MVDPTGLLQIETIYNHTLFQEFNYSSANGKNNQALSVGAEYAQCNNNIQKHTFDNNTLNSNLCCSNKHYNRLS